MTPRAKNQILTPWLIEWSKGSLNAKYDKSADHLFNEFAENLINAYDVKQIDSELQAIFNEMQAIVLSDLSWIIQSDLSWVSGEKSKIEYQAMLDRIYIAFNEQLKFSLKRILDVVHQEYDKYHLMADKIDDHYEKISRGFISQLVTSPEATKAYEDRSLLEMKKRLVNTKIRARGKLTNDIKNELEPLIREAKKEVDHPGFFSNKSLKKGKLDFLNKLHEKLNKLKGDVEDKVIVNAILQAADNKPLILHQILQSKSLNTKLTSLLNQKPNEDLLTFALKQKVENHAGDLRIYNSAAADSVEESIRLTAILAQKELNELKKSWSTKLKLTKVDFLCQLIEILKRHQSQPLAKAQAQIKQDLFTMLRAGNNLAYFQKAIQGTRVKELVLAVTGASTKELIKEFPRASAMPLSEQDDFTFNKLHVKETLNNVLRLIEEGDCENAFKVLQDSDVLKEKILPKNMDLSQKSPEDLRQLALFEKDMITCSRLGMELAKWELNNNRHKWPDPSQIDAFKRNYYNMQTQCEKDFRLVMSNVPPTDKKALEKSFLATDKSFDESKKSLDDNLGWVIVKSRP